MISKFIGTWERTVVQNSDQWTNSQRDRLIISDFPVETAVYLKYVTSSGKKIFGGLEYKEENYAELRFENDVLSFSANPEITMIIRFKSGSGFSIRKIDGREVDRQNLTPSARTINATMSVQGLIFGGQILFKIAP